MTASFSPAPPRISLFKRLVAASYNRKTRLHDEAGQRIALSRLVRNGPRALFSGAMRLAFNRRPALPWISYDAQPVLARLLRPDSTVLEFGSGMSTLWFGSKAGHVVSVEDGEGWYQHVGPRLRALGNVDYRFAAAPADYVAVAPDRAFDFIMIDGSWRDECAEFAIAHLAPGGAIYLDNSDKDANPLDVGDIPRARRILLDFAAREGMAVREFVDFAPTQLFVQRGMLIGPRSA